MPARFRDPQLEGPSPLSLPAVKPTPVIRKVLLHVRDSMRTAINSFGLGREYPYRPSYDPDASVLPEDLSNYSRPPDGVVPSPERPQLQPPWPFKNMSIFRLMQWMNTGNNQKSAGEVNRLINDVISAEDFSPTDLKGFMAQRENRRFDQSKASPDFSSKDGWTEVDVDIQVPTGVKNAPAIPFTIKGLHRRRLVDVIKAAFSEKAAEKFHLTPFKRFWKSPVTGNEERVYDEVYTSDAWLDAHAKLQKQPAEPGCQLERTIAGLMFWSDSTHLTNFGTAKVWPLYLYFANLSKYIRAKPTSGACHHIAYIPQVSYFDISCSVICSYVTSSLTASKILSKRAQKNVLGEPRPPFSPTAAVNLCIKFGAYCLMMSSWLHTNMGSSFVVQMEFHGKCTLAYLLIRRIILKSELSADLTYLFSV